MLVRLSVSKQRTSGVWWGGGAASLNPGDLIDIFICDGCVVCKWQDEFESMLEM